MVSQKRLYQDCAETIGKPVVAASLFYYETILWDTSSQEDDSKKDTEKAAKDEAREKHEELVSAARAKGITPIMVICLAKNDDDQLEIYVLDWIGNIRWNAADKATTRILVYFPAPSSDNLDNYKIKLTPYMNCTKATTRYFMEMELYDTKVYFTVAYHVGGFCGTGLFVPQRKMNEQVVEGLLAVERQYRQVRRQQTQQQAKN